MTQFELSEFLDTPFTLYKQDFKAEDISECLYKIHDNSVKLRHFLSANNEDEIEVMLLDHKGYFLHEFIDSDEPLQPIIDFDSPQEMLDTIELKLTRKEIGDLLYLVFIKTCYEVFLKWDYKIL